MDENRRDEILNYLRKNLAKGYTLESLKIALLKQGYSRIKVEQEIKRFNEELAKKAPVVKEKPKIKYEIIDENDRPVKIKKGFFQRFFGS